MKCLNCQKSLILQRSTKRFCDDKCRKYARRKRLAGHKTTLSGTDSGTKDVVSGTNKVLSGTISVTEPAKRYNPFTGKYVELED